MSTVGLKETLVVEDFFLMVRISGRALRLARGDGLTLSSRLGLTAVACHRVIPLPAIGCHNPRFAILLHHDVRLL